MIMKNILTENMRRFGTKNLDKNLRRQHFILNEETEKLVVPEIPGLVKQQQGATTILSLLHNDGNQRLFYISVSPSDEQYAVVVTSKLEPFFPLVKEIFNLIEEIDTEEKYPGQDYFEEYEFVGEKYATANFKMGSETLNKVMETLTSSVPLLLKKYKAEKIKKKTI